MAELKCPHQCLLILLLTSAAAVQASVSISLKNNSNKTMVYRKYSKYAFYDTSFSNRGFKKRGYLHQPEDDCGSIAPIQNSSDSTESWIAVNSNMECFDETVKNIKTAGYVLLIVASSNTSSAPSLSQYDFPIVIISRKYLDYLVENALSNFDDPVIYTTVEASNPYISLVTFGGAFIILLLVVIGIYIPMRYTNNCNNCSLCRSPSLHLSRNNPSYGRWSPSPITTLYRNLTGSTSSMFPLGPGEIDQISKERYRKGPETETCDICLEELEDGDEVRVLPCGHKNFHARCIEESLTSWNRRCPKCRHNVTKTNTAAPPEDHEEFSNDAHDADRSQSVPLLSRQQVQIYRSTSSSAL